MNNDSLEKKVLGSLGEVGKSIGKTLVDEGKKTVQVAASQIGIETVGGDSEKRKEVPSVTPEQQKVMDVAKKKNDAEFVQGLYAPSEKPATIPGEKPSAAPPSPKEIAGKSQDEQQKIAQLKKQLMEQHVETYYQPLVTPQKAEEKPLERVERQQMEELQEQKAREAEKPKSDPTLQREQTKTEKRPGAG